MGAITAAIMSFVAQGDHIVCVDQAYGPTKEFLSVYLSRFGVETTFVDGRLLENIREAVKPNTKLIYLESPTTMCFELQNLRECAEYAHSIGIHTMIDNTWATPIYQNPLAHGIDLVVHSITKYIAGHSDCVGGVVLGSRELVDRIGNNEYMLFGAIMTPQAAALISKGLRTSPLRMQRHETSGLTVAEHVRTLPFVHRVNHPGLPNHPQHELAASQMSGYSRLVLLHYEGADRDDESLGGQAEVFQNRRQLGRVRKPRHRQSGRQAAGRRQSRQVVYRTRKPAGSHGGYRPGVGIALPAVNKRI